MAETQLDSPARKLVPAVEKAAQVLSALGAASEPPGVSDLAHSLGLNKSTAFGLLQTLEHLGWVERLAGKRYRLGQGLVALGEAARRSLSLRDEIRAGMAALASETGHTVLLGVQSGRSAVLLEVAEAPGDLRISAREGQRIPLLAGAFGKVFLAYSGREGPDPELFLGEGPLRRFTPRTIVDPEVYRAELRRVAGQGFALDHQEYLEGVRGVGVPVFGAGGGLAGVLIAVGFVSLFTDEKWKGVVAATKAAGCQLSELCRLAGANDLGAGEVLGGGRP